MKKSDVSRFRRKSKRAEFVRANGAEIGEGLPLEYFSSQPQTASALYRYLAKGWQALPENRVRELGFEPSDEALFHEESLRHLACIFVDCMNLALEEAVVAKRKRLHA